MKNHYKALDELLAKKIKNYSEFISLLKEEWECVSNYSLEPVEKILERKEVLFAEIQKLNVLREQQVQAIAEAKGFSREEATLKKIISLEDNLWSQRMATHREKLREQIETINELNLANRNLIHRSALSMKKSMTWLYQVDAAYTPYHANGQLAEGGMQSRLVSTDA